MTIFLTSAGFDNKRVLHEFVRAARIEPRTSHVLLIPTAAITEGGKAMLPFCRDEIVEAGVQRTNITEVQISEVASLKDLDRYAAIYVAGGDTRHLVQEMNRHQFREILDGYLAGGGVYLGVSAGSIALTNAFPGCLNYLDCKLNGHWEVFE